MISTFRPLEPGQVIHGFAEGAFGRDHYHCVQVEAVGPDWLVARGPAWDGDTAQEPSVAYGLESFELCARARDKPCSAEACLLAHVAEPVTAEDHAWVSVWVHLNWETVTQPMGTKEREAAAAAALRGLRALDAADGRPPRAAPEGLRWWTY